MTPRQINLVQSSWRLLRDLDPQLVGDLFYTKLFLDYPELRPLFPPDMTGQHDKLVGKFNLVVARLHQMPLLRTHLKALALRHVGYGVLPEHYAYVGAALFWTLQRALGDDWNPEVAAAWQKAYQTLSAVMIECVGTPQPIT